MSEAANIQWFPGHMAKTKRLIKEALPLIDIVAELIDARIPYSSRNPEILEVTGNKPRIVLLNKSDTADENSTAEWIKRISEQEHIRAMAIDCKNGRGIASVLPLAREVLADKLALWQRKGMGNRPIRLMVVGIPNVGKSSFINKIAKNGNAKVADRPGVTRGNQWFKIDGGGELLDTPGVLWPKFDDSLVGEYLAFTGAIKDDVFDIEFLACRLLEYLNKEYPACIGQRYKIADYGDLAGHELLESIAIKRGMLIARGEANTERAAITLVDEFRGGKLGRISLERP